MAADFNGDGKTDIATANSGSNNISVLLSVSPVALAVRSTHTGNFYTGQTGATYTLTVSNSGSAPTSGTVVGNDVLPAGLTATALTGTGWTCDLGKLSCSRGESLAAAASYPAITLTVTVAANAASPLVNQVSVTGGGAPDAAAGDSTLIDSRAALLTPAPNSTLAGASATFTWDTGTGAVQYHLQVGSGGAGSANLFNQNTGVTRSQAVSGLPTGGGTLYVRLWSLLAAGAGWVYNDYTCTAATLATFAKAAMASPAPGSTLAGASATFSWDAGVSVAMYHLSVGTAAGGADVFTLNTGTSRSQAVTTLPTHGATLYVRLWSLLPTGWQYNDYTYTAATLQTSGKAAMTSPAPGSTLPGSSATFAWDAGSGALQYHLSVGTAGAGSANVFSLNTGTTRSQTVTTLPAGGGTVYVRLWSLLPTGWQYNDYTYTAAAALAKAGMTSPAPRQHALRRLGDFQLGRRHGRHSIPPVCGDRRCRQSQSVLAEYRRGADTVGQ